MDEPQPLFSMKDQRTKEAMLVFVGVIVATAMLFNWTNVAVAFFIVMLVFFREKVFAILEKVSKRNEKANQSGKENKQN